MHLDNRRIGARHVFGDLAKKCQIATKVLECALGKDEINILQVRSNVGGVPFEKFIVRRFGKVIPYRVSLDIYAPVVHAVPQQPI